ncbi:hypothetical protein [Derxia gummosa]|uniref:Uncharacterized protein n=1 Tax=Derxia gummosa DSM 723 TaxID=1121388 RepID=A0A8B6X8R9_9BURK|nr:hypothetical protein [Derxia gummosa]
MRHFSRPSGNTRALRLILPAFVAISAPVSAQVGPALAPDQLLGLYPAPRFSPLAADCTDCLATPQARFYFKGDLSVSPTRDAVGFDPARRAFDDLARWAGERGGQPEGRLPSLVWTGSPEIARGTLADAATRLDLGGGQSLAFDHVAKISTNLSFYDASSAAFFDRRAVIARGQTADGRFVARTLWPADHGLQALAPPQPLRPGETLESLVRAGQGDARASYSTRVLWQRDPAALDVAGKPVLAFILNGAQGDDDEAHGGHFAVATGRVGPGGEMNQWLVNNFYNLGSVSEKGIIASTVPLDAYLGELNSGQSWYRPSSILVAVLRDPRVPGLYQEGIGRVFQHFYRQDFPYRHATANCTGLNVETLRTLGWRLPKLGAESRLKAAIALPYVAIRDGSLQNGKSAYDYLSAERTDLYPLVGFTSLGDDLLGRITRGGAAGSGLEAQLAQDIEAVILVQVPQFPSSRAVGQAPVGSMEEYLARAPANKADWKIVPVAPRPFPAELRDAAAPAAEGTPADTAVLAEGAMFAGLGGLGLFGLGRAFVRRRAARGRPAA